MQLVELVFEKTMQAILGLDLPRVLHCREGARDLFERFKEKKPKLGKPLSEACYKAQEVFGEGGADLAGSVRRAGMRDSDTGAVHAGHS